MRQRIFKRDGGEEMVEEGKWKREKRERAIVRVIEKVTVGEREKEELGSIMVSPAARPVVEIF
jgi:hypothetical protein